jgi:ubiquinone/menaquinone biosynthesis C-methylase UbiE
VAELILPSRQAVPSLAGAPDAHLVDLIYHPLSGLVYRRRFTMVLDQLDAAGRGDSILEVGCGAGLLLPSLAGRFAKVEAVDIHDHTADVQRMVRELGMVQAVVRPGSILQLPYADGAFTHAVSLSVLEHLTDLDTAMRELSRVVRPGGTVVLGFPTKNLVTKALFRLVGYNDDEIHPSSHRAILAAGDTRMRREALTVMPGVAPLDLSFYCVARYRTAS